MNKTIEKKVDLNVICTVLSDVQFAHQGAGQEKKCILGGTPYLFSILKYILKTFILPVDLDLV